jgi:hypothetical protein
VPSIVSVNLLTVPLDARIRSLAILRLSDHPEPKERETEMKNRIEDVAAVRVVLNGYVRGSGGDIELLRSVFHPDATMNGYYSGSLGIGSPEPFFAQVAALDASAPLEDYRAEIEAIEVLGDVATATLVETGFLGSDFVDFFHLIRVDGEWKIISKTYYQAS